MVRVCCQPQCGVLRGHQPVYAHFREPAPSRSRPWLPTHGIGHRDRVHRLRLTAQGRAGPEAGRDAVFCGGHAFSCLAVCAAGHDQRQAHRKHERLTTVRQLRADAHQRRGHHQCRVPAWAAEHIEPATLRSGRPPGCRRTQVATASTSFAPHRTGEVRGEADVRLCLGTSIIVDRRH